MLAYFTTCQEKWTCHFMLGRISRAESLRWQARQEATCLYVHFTNLLWRHQFVTVMKVFVETVRTSLKTPILFLGKILLQKDGKDFCKSGSTTKHHQDYQPASKSWIRSCLQTWADCQQFAISHKSDCLYHTWAHLWLWGASPHSMNSLIEFPSTLKLQWRTASTNTPGSMNCKIKTLKRTTNPQDCFCSTDFIVDWPVSVF